MTPVMTRIAVQGCCRRDRRGILRGRCYWWKAQEGSAARFTPESSEAEYSPCVDVRTFKGLDVWHQEDTAIRMRKRTRSADEHLRAGYERLVGRPFGAQYGVLSTSFNASVMPGCRGAVRAARRPGHARCCCPSVQLHRLDK
jgi:hypothetical protein